MIEDTNDISIFTVEIRLYITTTTIRNEMRLLVLVTSVFVYGIELYIKGRRDVVYGAALSIRCTCGPSLGFIYTVRHPVEKGLPF